MSRPKSKVNLDLYPQDDQPQLVAGTLGIEFRDADLLRQALTHRSYLNDQGIGGAEAARGSNERLEFLGDAVLDMIVAEFVFDRFAELPEGLLTNYRTALVRTETLAQWVRDCGLDALLYLGRGERSAEGVVQERILAGAFEAIVAAIYIDRGMEETRRFLTVLLQRDAETIIATGQEMNYKSRLQELIQERDRVAPVYHTVAVSGPEHQRDFTVDVVVNDLRLGRGTGSSKRLAQQQAARNALMQLATEGVIEEDERNV